MTIATVIIKDLLDNQYSIEGTLDRAEALDEPPTPALIISIYLSSHIKEISDDAMAWYNQMGAVE
jgi:hypothetical protein